MGWDGCFEIERSPQKEPGDRQGMENLDWVKQRESSHLTEEKPADGAGADPHSQESTRAETADTRSQQGHEDHLRDEHHAPHIADGLDIAPSIADINRENIHRTMEKEEGEKPDQGHAQERTLGEEASPLALQSA